MNIAELPRPKKPRLNQLPVMAKSQIAHASLPANYIAAREALKECERVDEVKDIADKHSAIAHYAKQIKDDSLRYYAERVYLRALARVGELLNELPTTGERKEAAKANGISQADTSHARNMTHLPQRALDALIEKTPPASKTEISYKGYRLTERGMRSRFDNARTSFSHYTRDERMTTPYGRMIEAIEYVIDDLACKAPEPCQLHREEGDGTLPDAIRWAQMLAPDEARKIRPQILRMIEFFDDFERGLPKEPKQ